MSRPLPDFLGIGVPKAGTTSLHRYLAAHPDVAMSRTKEPHYFVHADGRRAWCGPGDDRSTAGDVYAWDDYQALFEDAGGRVAGEFSPQYLADPAVPARVRRRLPDARFLLILRDPVARAYSNFLHLRRNHREPVADFEQALALEDERLAAGWEPFWGYRNQSRYGTHLRPWLAAFPRDRFLALSLDELRRAPREALHRVHDFLGVAHHDPDYEVHNAGGVARVEFLRQRLQRAAPFGGASRYVLPAFLRRRLHRSLRRLNARYPPIDPATDARLRQEFLPEVEAVERALGLGLAAWKPRPGGAAAPSRPAP